MPAGKEAMTAETFDEDDYANNLIDKEGYSEVTARMLAKKKKDSMAAKKIEIDLGSLMKDDFKWKMSDGHLSPEERKKRQEQRDKRQKGSAAHQAVRRKQHKIIEEGIPEGK